MAASTTTTSTASTTSFLKLQNQPIKPKRRKYRETTISTSAHAHAPSPDPARTHEPEPDPTFPASPSSDYRIRFSPGRSSPIMDFIQASPTGSNGHSGQHDPFPSSFTKFNSALTAGLLNPMSPPPDKTRSSPTLFEMMASEPDTTQHRTQIPSGSGQKPNVPVLDRQTLMMQRISEILASRSPGNQFNDAVSSDIKLTLSSKDGISISMNVHRQILVAHSRFFAVKLSDRWTTHNPRPATPYMVEIADCDDVEVYIETLKLMYCKDIRKRLMKEDVSKVLGILKVLRLSQSFFVFRVLWFMV